VEERGNIIDHILAGDQSLRSAETSESSVGRQVGFAHISGCTEIRNVVAIVTGTQGTPHHLQHLALFAALYTFSTGYGTSSRRSHTVIG